MSPAIAVSKPPRPIAKKDPLADLRPQAAVLYRSLKAAPAGLSWIECFAACGQDAQVGLLIVWLRSKGVSIAYDYNPTVGTVFRLSLPDPEPVPESADTVAGQ